MTGLPPREARQLSLAEVIAWAETLKAEAAARRLAAARARR
jgi:hypothetical protein